MTDADETKPGGGDCTRGMSNGDDKPQTSTRPTSASAVQSLLSKLAQAGPINIEPDSNAVPALDAALKENGHTSQEPAVSDVDAATADTSVIEPPDHGLPAKSPRVSGLDALVNLVIGRWDKVAPNIWTPERTARERLAVIAEVKEHRVVLLLILSMAVYHKSIIFWLLFVALWTLCERVYPVLPGSWRAKCKLLFLSRAASVKESGWLDELEEAVGYTRPFSFLHCTCFLPLSPLAGLPVIGCGKSFRQMMSGVNQGQSPQR